MGWNRWPSDDAKGLARYVLADVAERLSLDIVRDDKIKENNRKAVIRAIYEALGAPERMLRYGREKYTAGDEPQFIRNPYQLLESGGNATCLDLAVLFAGACLGNELLPLVVLVEGHAFVAVSLNDDPRNPDSLSRRERDGDLDWVENGISTNRELLNKLLDNGAYLPVECTGFAKSETMPPEVPEGQGRRDGRLDFDAALTAGRKQLDARRFESAIDPAVLQLKGYDTLDPWTGVEDLASLRLKATKAATTLIRNAKKRWHYPDIAVPVRLELRETSSSSDETPRWMAHEELLSLVRNRTNLFLVGEVGAGKTTTLIELCAQLIDEETSPIPLFLDAATWAASGKPLLDHVASLSVFSSAALNTTALARLHEADRLLIVLNGWNEISSAREADARQRLQQFLTGTTIPRIIVSTRATNNLLGIPDAKLVAIRGFGWDEQHLLVRRSLDPKNAEALLARIRSNRKLLSVTQNPLVLDGVLSLQRSERPIPDGLFEILEAIVDTYENEEERSVALRQPPLRGFHREYVQAIAEKMNEFADIHLPDSKARRTVIAVSKGLKDEGSLVQLPEPADVLSESCNHHLLHRSDDESVRFGHQRFQDFFAARSVLSRLRSAVTSETKRASFREEILNWPFWEDAVELAATKLATDSELSAEKRLLVELAIPLDLAFAARIAGEVRLSRADGAVWQTLRDELETLHGHPDREAQRYALECMAATRSSEFAHRLWPILESDNCDWGLSGYMLAYPGLKKVGTDHPKDEPTSDHPTGYYRLTGGLVVRQLGDEAASRMSAWPEERRARSVEKFAQMPENFSFIQSLAQSDICTTVRAAAIHALHRWYMASEAALQAWRSAPENVKEHEAALATALDLWRAEDGTLTAELVELARGSAREGVKHQIGLRLLAFAEEIGLEAVREALWEKQMDPYVWDAIFPYLRSADPVFHRALVLENVWTRLPMDEWVFKELIALPLQDREELMDQALDVMSSPDFDGLESQMSMTIAAVASGANDTQIRKLVDEAMQLLGGLESGYWVGLLDTPIPIMGFSQPVEDRDSVLLRRIGRLLACVPSEPLVDVVLSRARACTYDEAACLVGILEKQVPGDDDWRSQPLGEACFATLIAARTKQRDPQDFVRIEASQFDRLIAAFLEKRDPRQIPECSLEAHLASLASKISPNHYLGFLLEATKRYAHAWHTHDQVVQYGLTSHDGYRPIEPTPNLYFVRALKRCQFDAAKGLIAMAGEPGAGHIVPEALCAIVRRPWELCHDLSGDFLLDHRVRDHLTRQKANRVFQQPEDDLQPVTDEVAQTLVDRLEAMTVPGGALDGIDASQPSAIAHTYWEGARLLSRIPSPVGVSTLNKVLSRQDSQRSEYLSIAHGIINQGGNLPEEVLPGIKSLWQREVAARPLDNKTQDRLCDIGALLFFVEPIDAGLGQLKEFLPEWVSKATMWRVALAVSPLPTKEAVKILLELLPLCKSHEDVERVVRALAMNSTPQATQSLMSMVVGDTFSKMAPQLSGKKIPYWSMHKIEREIALKLAKERFDGNTEEVQRLLSRILEASSDPAFEERVCEALGKNQDPRATDLLYHYLDEEKHPYGGEAATTVLEGKFVQHQLPQPGEVMYSVHSKACNKVRRELFSLASKSGPSQRRARALLISLENDRGIRGRPADEPRHPNLESSVSWPSGLYAP